MRPLRLDLENTFYHITSRGVGRKNIFIEQDDYQIFLEYLKKAKKKFLIDVYCYVLMGNHFHLLVETHKANLSKFMQWLLSQYAMYFNRKYNRSGHLFQGRYLSLIVDSDSYFKTLFKYILYNPVRAGIVGNVFEYRWSTLSELNLPEAQRIVNFRKVESYFGDFEKMRRELEKAEELEWFNLQKEVYGAVILGSKAFTAKIKEEILKAKPELADVTKSRKLKKRMDKNDILRIINNYFAERQAKQKTPKEKMLLTIYLLHEFTDMPAKKIGEIVGKTQKQVYNDVYRKKQYLSDPNFQRLYMSLREKILRNEKV